MNAARVAARTAQIPARCATARIAAARRATTRCVNVSTAPMPAITARARIAPARRARTRPKAAPNAGARGCAGGRRRRCGAHVRPPAGTPADGPGVAR